MLIQGQEMEWAFGIEGRGPSSSMGLEKSRDI
jgi:hypothetical protein